MGRPNVGKSTLFNRLVGQHVAIVDDRAGVTRDRNYADAVICGRPCTLIDTGGFDPTDESSRTQGVAQQVRIAVEECALVVCVFDGTTETTGADREAVRLLRGSGKPTIYVGNKIESAKRVPGGLSLYELGLTDVLLVSALHADGIGELEDRIAAHLPAPRNVDAFADLDVPRIAIVGRPNAGKSSITNRLLGEDRQLVDDKPGTTIDAIDTLLERDGKTWVLVDTAGIRKKSAVHQGLESLSVLYAIRAMERCDVVVLVIDAKTGAGEQDAKIAALAEERGRALVIALNKSDLLSPTERDQAVQATRDLLRFAPWAPLLVLSAKTGRAVGKLLETATAAVGTHRKRVPTAELNRFFEEVLDHHPPPTFRGRSVRLFYVTQAQTKPPTFVAVTNYSGGVHASYQRYVANQLRERFGFEGTPLRVHYRAKKRR